MQKEQSLKQALDEALQKAHSYSSKKDLLKQKEELASIQKEQGTAALNKELFKRVGLE